MDPPNRVSPVPPVPPAPRDTRARLPADSEPSSLGVAAVAARPGASADPPVRGAPGSDRIAVAFDAINALANCIDQTIRELRRGTAAQWRFVQDELTRVRRLVAAPRPSPTEGPPRDEGPASQPPPPEPTSDARARSGS